MATEEEGINYKTLLRLNNTYMLGLIADRLAVLHQLLVSFEDGRIQEVVIQIIEFDGKRDVEDYGSDKKRSYDQLCSDAWETLRGRDCGSSHGMRSQYRFLGEIILSVSEEKKEALLKEKQRKLERLKEETFRLEKEITEEQANE